MARKCVFKSVRKWDWECVCVCACVTIASLTQTHWAPSAQPITPHFFLFIIHSSLILSTFQHSYFRILSEKKTHPNTSQHCVFLPLGDTLRDFLLSEGHSLLLLGEKLLLLPRRSSVNTERERELVVGKKDQSKSSDIDALLHVYLCTWRLLQKCRVRREGARKRSQGEKKW